MKIGEITNIIKILRGTKSCIVIKDSLQLQSFGEKDSVVDEFEDKIMHIRLDKHHA